MSMKILDDDKENNKLTIELDNGDYAALDEVVSKWHFKDRVVALRFALSILFGTKNGKLCIAEENGAYSIIVPTDEVLEKNNATKE